jgi:transcriptional regulator with XRE-family HTH domain
MNFANNLQNLRKINNLSQEDLATKLNVSRQTISKWESGNTYPESDKLIDISNLFKVKIDDLIKKEIEEEVLKNSYTRENKLYALSIALGVFIIFIAVISLDLLKDSNYQPMLFFSLIGVAVSLFIIFRFRYSNFKLENPTLNFTYNNQEIQNFNTKFSLLLSLGIILILFGLGITEREGPLALLIPTSVAVFIFVYMGILKSRLNVDKYNSKFKKEDVLTDKITAVIMLVATFIFLLLGFLFHLWHIAWVVFPLGGILCGIIDVILEKK